MSQRFQVFRANRVWVVIDNTTKQPAAEPFHTEAGADAECDRLELQAWRDSRPVTALSEPLSFDTVGDVEERLLAIINKPCAEYMVFDVRAAA